MSEALPWPRCVLTWGHSTRKGWTHKQKAETILFRLWVWPEETGACTTWLWELHTLGGSTMLCRSAAVSEAEAKSKAAEYAVTVMLRDTKTLGQAIAATLVADSAVAPVEETATIPS